MIEKAGAKPSDGCHDGAARAFVGSGRRPAHSLKGRGKDVLVIKSGEHTPLCARDRPTHRAVVVTLHKHRDLTVLLATSHKGFLLAVGDRATLKSRRRGTTDKGRPRPISERHPCAEDVQIFTPQWRQEVTMAGRQQQHAL